MTETESTKVKDLRHERWRLPVLAIALVAAVFVAYLPALGGVPLLDDEHHLTRAELRSVVGLARIWTDIGATQQYYPALHTAFWIEHRLWGDSVVGYHMVNVLWHACAALLVVAIMRELGLRGAWLAGFAFALHPLGVESVAWISEQKNTLSAVCALAAVWFYLRFAADGRRVDYLVAGGAFLIGLLSKTAIVTLPAVLLVLAWWRRGRLSWRTDVRPLLPWFAAGLIAGLVTLRVESRLIRGIDAELSLSWLERMLVAGRALWFYAAQVIWPANLTFFYERWVVDAALWQYVFPLAVVGLGLALGARARTNRGPLAALLVFFLLLLPVLGFVDIEWFVFAYVADHFAYLASLAIIVPIASSLAPAVASLCGKVGAIAALASLAALTWRHSGTFRDNITLYRQAVAESPGSVVAHHHLGVALADDPARRADAIAEFEVALRLNPMAAEAHAGLGRLLLVGHGRFDDAVQHLEAAVQLKPTLADVRTRLAGAWFDRGKAAAADPDLAESAIAAYANALRADPGMVEAHYNLANLLLRDPARRAEAIAHYEAAVRLKPDFAEARLNLGVAVARLPGRLDEAIAHFQAALRANPNFTAARNNLERAQRERSATVSPQR